MKIRVDVTVELTPEQVKNLKKLAKCCGHGHDGTKAPGRLIRRYLEFQVRDAVTYCHEQLSKD